MLSREQWAVGCAIDGARSAQDLAWTCGLALYDAIECIGRLIQAGVCVPEPAEPAGPLARWFGPEVRRHRKTRIGYADGIVTTNDLTTILSD